MMIWLGGGGDDDEKSVLHYVADDSWNMFSDNAEAQFEMLFTLINDYNVDEEITTADKHGNHVCFLHRYWLWWYW